MGGSSLPAALASFSHKDWALHPVHPTRSSHSRKSQASEPGSTGILGLTQRVPFYKEETEGPRGLQELAGLPRDSLCAPLNEMSWE